MTNNNVLILEDAQADFDTFLAQEKWDDARAIVDNLGDQGFEHEAFLLHQAFNRAFATSFSEKEEDPRDIADRDYPRE